MKKIKKPQEKQIEIFVCEGCGKTKDFTQKEIAKNKKTDADLLQDGFDYYIPCPFCTGGYMLSQIDMAFHQMAADLFG